MGWNPQTGRAEARGTWLGLSSKEGWERILTAPFSYFSVYFRSQPTSCHPCVDAGGDSQGRLDTGLGSQVQDHAVLLATRVQATSRPLQPPALPLQDGAAGPTGEGPSDDTMSQGPRESRALINSRDASGRCSRHAGPLMHTRGGQVVGPHPQGVGGGASCPLSGGHWAREHPGQSGTVTSVSSLQALWGIEQ